MLERPIAAVCGSHMIFGEVMRELTRHVAAVSKAATKKPSRPSETKCWSGLEAGNQDAVSIPNVNIQSLTRFFTILLFMS